MNRRPARVSPSRVLHLPNLPDNVLINKLVEYGQPRPQATMAMDSPQLRACAIIFYFDTLEAQRGDREAKERVDYCREQWEHLRKQARALGQDPDRPPVARTGQFSIARTLPRAGVATR